MITEQEVDKALAYLRDTAGPAAIARANVAYSTEFIKIVRAKVKTAQIGMSNAAAEDVALTSDDYLHAIEAMRAAVEDDSRYRFLREAADAKIRAWQTEQASLRAEGRAYG